MAEDQEEGQPEVNILRRRMAHRSWRVISKDYQAQNLTGYLDLRDP